MLDLLTFLIAGCPPLNIFPRDLNDAKIEFDGVTMNENDKDITFKINVKVKKKYLESVLDKSTRDIITEIERAIRPTPTMDQFGISPPWTEVLPNPATSFRHTGTFGSLPNGF